jgi:hypothetical protein
MLVLLSDRMFNIGATVFDYIWYWETTQLNCWANFTASYINATHFSFTLKQVTLFCCTSIDISPYKNWINGIKYSRLL